MLARIAPATSFAPSIAAFLGSLTPLSNFEKIFSKYSGLKDVDLSVYWFRLAHLNKEDNGRTGIDARNTIKEGKNRKPSLDYILANKGYIHNAISSQKWSGAAKVYVRIINWSKEYQVVLTLAGKVVSEMLKQKIRKIIDE